MRWYGGKNGIALREPASALGYTRSVLYFIIIIIIIIIINPFLLQQVHNIWFFIISLCAFYSIVYSWMYFFGGLVGEGFLCYVYHWPHGCWACTSTIRSWTEVNHILTFSTVTGQLHSLSHAFFATCNFNMRDNGSTYSYRKCSEMARQVSFLSEIYMFLTIAC